MATLNLIFASKQDKENFISKIIALGKVIYDFNIYYYSNDYLCTIPIKSSVLSLTNKDISNNTTNALKLTIESFNLHNIDNRNFYLALDFGKTKITFYNYDVKFNITQEVNLPIKIFFTSKDALEANPFEGSLSLVNEDPRMQLPGNPAKSVEHNSIKKEEDFSYDDKCRIFNRCTIL